MLQKVKRLFQEDQFLSFPLKFGPTMTKPLLIGLFWWSLNFVALTEPLLFIPSLVHV